MIPTTPPPGAEAWLAKRLGLALSWDAGVTTMQQRREILRAAIIQQGRVWALAGRKRGEKPETFGEVFSRAFGVEVEPPEKRKP